MNTDGNTYAINRHLEAQELHDAAQPEADMYCTHCDETISGRFDPKAIATQKCPNCSEELYELP
jgi:uncharacterized paraquat-inducible protein A|tara:strand:- start:479 stop:670 length:192 start_codon:yes stop_codon:yes gene_type:complete